MSKRAGTVITIDDLVEAIGADAARYALARYCSDCTIDIDLDLWSRPSSDNPVYYVQYAHARVSSLLRNGADLGVDHTGADHHACWSHEKEGELLRALAELPAGGQAAATLREPHRVARYLEDTAGVLPPLLRQLPGAADGRRGAQRPAPRPAAAGRGHPHRHRQRARAARRLRPGADVS